MNESGGHLNLVFNESGDDSLILESWWGGGVNREPPDLSEVGRAKLRLRALCIVLLLAKYQGSQLASPTAVLIFKPKIETGTCICTLGNAWDELTDWIKTRFNIHDRESFLVSSPGSTHNKGGKVYPSVKFYTQRLPLGKLHLFVNSAMATRKQARELHDEELIQFALKFEADYWRKSAVKAWLSPSTNDGTVAAVPLSQVVQQTPKTHDDFLLTGAVTTPESDKGATAVDLKEHFKEVFLMLLAKEIENYRQNCRAFFSYIGKGIIYDHRPWMDRVTTLIRWWPKQLAVLRDNCIFYSVHNYDSIQNVKKAGSPLDIACVDNWRFPPCIWSRFPCIQVHDAPVRIFKKLKTGPFDYADPEPSALVLPEAKEAVRVLSWGLNNSKRPTAFGTFLAQQVIFLDFLNEVCWPLDIPASSEGETPRSQLHYNILGLRGEASGLKSHWLLDFCKG